MQISKILKTGNINFCQGGEQGDGGTEVREDSSLSFKLCECITYFLNIKMSKMKNQEI